MRFNRRKDVSGQLMLQFGKTQVKAPNLEMRARLTKQPRMTLEKKREIKSQALGLARKAYAIIVNSPGILRGANLRYIADCKREFGVDIGALRKGRMSTSAASAVISRANGFFERFGIK